MKLACFVMLICVVNSGFASARLDALESERKAEQEEIGKRFESWGNGLELLRFRVFLSPVIVDDRVEYGSEQVQLAARRLEVFLKKGGKKVRVPCRFSTKKLKAIKHNLACGAMFKLVIRDRKKYSIVFEKISRAQKGEEIDFNVNGFVFKGVGIRINRRNYTAFMQAEKQLMKKLGIN